MQLIHKLLLSNDVWNSLEIKEINYTVDDIGVFRNNWRKRDTFVPIEYLWRCDKCLYKWTFVPTK